MNIFNLFRPRSKSAVVQHPIQTVPKSNLENKLNPFINQFKQQPNEENYQIVIKEIIKMYCKDPKNFPSSIDFSGIVESLFDKIKINSIPSLFVQEIIFNRFNEFSLLAVLTHSIPTKFSKFQIEKLCEIVVDCIRFVIDSPPTFRVKENPIIFPVFQHHNQIMAVPLKIKPVKSNPQLQIISYLLSIIGPFSYFDLPDLSFVDEIQPNIISAFIDHYYRYLPLHLSSTPSPLVKKVKIMCANLVETDLEEKQIEHHMNNLLCLIVCLTKLSPESPVDYPGLFPYNLSIPPTEECLTYYFNIIQSTNNFTFVLPMVYSLSFFISNDLEEAYYLLVRKIHLYVHSVHTNTHFFQEQLNAINIDQNQKRYVTLLNAFVRIITCLSIEERRFFFEFIKKNSKNYEIMEPIIGGLIYIQLSRFYVQEFILESGLSYYLRQLAINSKGELRIKTLKYLVVLMRDNDVLKYFKTTEPTNFFSNIIRTISNKEEFELSVEFMTLLLLDTDIEKINTSIGYIKLFKRIEGLNKLEYQIQLMKLWKLKINVASEDTVRDFMYYLKKCFQEKEGNKEYFTTFFDSLSSLKENEFGKKLFVEFMKEEETFNRIKEIQKVLGNDLFITLRNISLTSMFNIIDEPVALSLILKLLLSLNEEESDQLIGDIFIPLTSQCENLDVLSRGEIPQLLIPFVIKSKKSSHVDFLLKNIVNYHCNHHVLEELIKYTHSNKRVQDGIDSIIISSFEQFPTPSYYLDLSQHLVNKISFKLPFNSQKPFSLCTWFNIHSFPEYKTPSVQLLSFANPQHTLGIHATPVGITVYFKNSRELFQMAIREKMFHCIIITLNQTEKSDKCKVEVYLDGSYMGCIEGIGSFGSNTELTLQSTEQVRLRISNILIYRKILEEAHIQRIVYCENPDLVPTNENWYCPIDIRMPKECPNVPFFLMVNVRTKQIITQKDVSPLNIIYGQPLINGKQQEPIRRCIHGKKMMELLGGYDVLLLLMAEMKDELSVLSIFGILTKYLAKNGKASHDFCEDGGLKIIFNIFNSKPNLFNMTGLVDGLLEFSTDHQKEVFTSPLLVDKVVLNVDFWKKGNDDVISLYLKKVAISLKSPHVQSTIGMLEECRVFERFLQFIDRSIQNKNIREPFIDVMSGLLQLSSWRSYLHQIAMIVQTNFSTEQVMRCTVYNDNTNQGESIVLAAGNVTVRTLINSIDVSNSSDTEGMDPPNTEALVLVLQILLTRALNIEDKDQVCEFLTAASGILPIGVILELIAVVKKQYINDVLKYMCLILSIQPIYSKFIRLGGFIRLFNSLRSYRRVNKYSYYTIRILSSFIRTLFLLNFDKGSVVDIASDPSLLLLLCTLNEIPSNVLGMIVKEFSEDCIKPEGRNLVSCKMYNEVVFHSILNVVHRNDNEKILEGLLLMYDSAMNESQKRSVQQVASKVHLHYLYITSLVMSETFDSTLLWKLYVFIADMHKKYVVTQGRRSQKYFFINAIARIWKEILQYDLPLNYQQQKSVIDKLFVRDFIIHFEQRQALFEEKYNNVNVSIYYIQLLKVLGINTILCTELEQQEIQNNNTILGYNEFKEDVMKFVDEIFGTVERKEYLHPYLIQIQPTAIPNDLDFIRPPSRSFKMKSNQPSRVACLHWRKIFKKYTSPKELLAYEFPSPITTIKLEPCVTPSFLHCLIDYSTHKMRDLPTTETITPEIEEELKNYLNLKEIVPYVPPIALINGVKCKRIKEEKECDGFIQVKGEGEFKEIVFQYTKIVKNENVTKELVLSLNNAVITKKTYLYQDNALEIITNRGRIEFFIFPNKQRNKIIEITGCSESKLVEYTKLWTKGVLSNFEYLGILNNEAGRSYRTLSQYPIYPWVLCSYDTKDFRLSDIQMYRNLQLPIGAQKGTNQIEDNYYEKECHYNCCLSSPSTVLRCLFRLRPYTEMILKEMSGRCLEIDGRIFTNVGSLYASSVLQSRIELLPEFYCCPEVFLNLNHLKGENSSVGDVNFPPWGETSRLFIHHMREALESQEVGQTIHNWIDLMFGIDQQNRNKFNVYSKEYTKESEMDDEIKEVIWRTMGNIPNKLFIKNHPKRLITPRLSFNFHNPHTELVTTLKNGFTFAYENNKFISFEEKCSIFSVDKDVFCVKYDQDKGSFILLKNDQQVSVLSCKALDITDFEVCDNGNKLLYGCETGESYIVLQPFTKNPIFVGLHGVTDKVTAVAYCNDFHTAVIASNDGVIRYYNVDGKIRQIIETRETVNKMVFSNKNGDLITLSMKNNKTYISGYSINAYKFADTFVNTTITAFTITHFMDGSMMNILVLGSDGGELMLYELEKLELLGSCYGGRSLNSSGRNSSKVLSILFVENYSKLFFFVESIGGIDVLEIK